MYLSMVHKQKSTIDRANWLQGLTGGLSAVVPGVAAMVAEQFFVTVFRHRRPQREDVWAEGAARIQIPSPHGELAAWTWGSGPKTILLVHGWAGRALQLGAFVEPLVNAGYRVVAYDRPAHGESPGRRTNIFKLTDGLCHRRILCDPAVVAAATDFMVREATFAEPETLSHTNAVSAA